MPGLGEVKEFVAWLIDAYGVASSLLICFVGFLVYQLRQEQKEGREVRMQMAEALEKSVAVQILFANALAELKAALKNKGSV
jgi:hypothetical protein